MAVPKKRKSRAWRRHTIKINVINNNLTVKNKFYFNKIFSNLNKFII
jgi:hypothetical protein